MPFDINFTHIATSLRLLLLQVYAYYCYKFMPICIHFMPIHINCTLIDTNFTPFDIHFTFFISFLRLLIQIVRLLLHILSIYRLSKKEVSLRDASYWKSAYQIFLVPTSMLPCYLVFLSPVCHNHGH